MPMEVHCRDLGFDCDAVAQGESAEEVLEEVAAHARTVHGLTDEQLGDPVLQQQVREQSRPA